MGRTLPWKKNQGVSVTSKSSTSSGRSRRPTTPPPVKDRSTPSSFTADVARGSKKAKNVDESSDDDEAHGVSLSHQARPEAVPESFMIPGLAHDDMWRMVEDEFIATAHKFTAHLHAAEYQRLKDLARGQNAAAIQSLSRPVTGAMTVNAKRRHTMLSLRRSQARGVKRALSRCRDGEDDDVDEKPWAGTNLQELMDSPRKRPVPLTKMVSTVSSTRAAALNRQKIMASTQTSQTGSSSAHRTDPARLHAKQAFGAVDKSAVGCSQPGSMETGSGAGKNRPSHTSMAIASNQGNRLAADKQEKTATAPRREYVADDSDSSVETMFGKHLRERRNQRKMPRRRNKSTTPGPAQDDGQPSQKSQKSQVPDSLSIPSF